MTLKKILDSIEMETTKIGGIEFETFLIDYNGEEWTPEEIDTEKDDHDYCFDGMGIWALDEYGFRDTTATFKFMMREKSGG